MCHTLLVLHLDSLSKLFSVKLMSNMQATSFKTAQKVCFALSYTKKCGFKHWMVMYCIELHVTLFIIILSMLIPSPLQLCMSHNYGME